MSWAEIIASAFSLVCVALLARNSAHGWWVGLVGIVAYAWVFYESRLFAEIGLQAVYFVTSVQAIWIWLKGGAERTERPVTHVPPRLWIPALLVGCAATFGLIELLTWMRGAVPFWDALTTVISLIAHVFLMLRYVESWYLWVLVDTIYVPLFWSRDLKLTAGLYVVFWFMALHGYFNFEKLAREKKAA